MVRTRFNKKQVSEVRKKWETNVWNPVRVKLFFYSSNQKVRKWEFFKLVWVKFDKPVLEVRKKWNTNVWSLDFVRKLKTHFFQKKHARAIEDFFSDSYKKMCKGKFFYLVGIQFSRTNPWSTEKMKNKRLACRLGCKSGKI